MLPISCLRQTRNLVGYSSSKVLLQTYTTQPFYPRIFSRTQTCLPRFGKIFKLSQTFVRRSLTVAKETSQEISPRAAKLVGTWLIGCSGMVVGAVILGGVTRLTKSGLSMVDWHFFKEFPPLSHEAWQAEFHKYQQFPEFKQHNQDMTLKEFQWIWWMEYAHRMWGRATGLLFFIPAALLWQKKCFSASMKKRVLIFGSLVLFQGLLGWYMVKSGLEEKADSNETVRVSQYRLAAHLGTAFILYSLLLWSGLSHLLPPQQMPVTDKLRKFKRLAGGAKLVVFLTALSGAFVAGVEGGLIYNTFPKMADRWIPSDILALSPKWRNITENPTMIQFNHRLLGETVFCFVSAMWWYSRKLPLMPRARLAMNSLFAVTLFQVSLGILTLLLQVPKPLAASHQTGALTVLSTAIWLAHELKFIKMIPK